MRQQRALAAADQPVVGEPVLPPVHVKQHQGQDGHQQDPAQAMIVQTQFLSSLQDVCMDIAARSKTFPGNNMTDA